MNSYLVTEKPTIYADMNIYRYLACGDISIIDPERFIWVYSHVHLNEVHRSGNTDALKGMKLLRAVELSDVLNEKFESVSNITLRNYIDPYTRYEQHLEAILGYEDSADYMVEHIIRLFGADNFQELSKTPEKMRAEIERITSSIDGDKREQLLKKATSVSNEMKESIEKHLKDRKSIDKTRSAFGITSENRKIFEKAGSPIDEIWDLISSSIPNVTKDQFFGFELIQEIEGIQHTQYSSISGAHMVLNLLGIDPDNGLSRRDKIKNIMSDGHHAGMASYCNALISADRAFVNKARCIYTYLNNITCALHFVYHQGYVLNLETEKT
ncbi:MAG: hypothetical protein Q7T32_11590 [Moraxellaceae bacterium]|nr:hypothetical protein [Moraxellaceae bacterium]